MNTKVKIIRVQYAGKKRCPKKGEWYISGAIPEGYKASNDLRTPFHIGTLVLTEAKTIVTTTVIKEEEA